MQNWIDQFVQEITVLIDLYEYENDMIIKIFVNEIFGGLYFVFAFGIYSLNIIIQIFCYDKQYVYALQKKVIKGARFFEIGYFWYSIAFGSSNLENRNFENVNICKTRNLQNSKFENIDLEKILS